MKFIKVLLVVLLLFSTFLLAESLLFSGTATASNNPTITYISPNSKYAGDSGFTMNLVGTNFAVHYVNRTPYGRATVMWSGTAVPTHWASSTHLTADISAERLVSARTVMVKVMNQDLNGVPTYPSNEEPFTINNRAATTGELIPDRCYTGDPGFTLTVGGANFVSGSKVRWNGSYRTTAYVNPAALKAEIPASDIAVGGTATVTVFNPAPGGGSSGSQTFTINNPDPTITSLSPQEKAAGDRGFDLTINGNGFVPNSKVRWNNSERSSTFVSSTKLTATIPTSDLAETGTATVTVLNPAPGGGTSNARSFFITKPAPPTPKTSSVWFLAEGATYDGFEEWVLIQNPNSKSTSVTCYFCTQNGFENSAAYTMAPNSRISIRVNDFVPNKDVATEVVSKEHPVCVERAMYMNTADGKRGSHDSIATAVSSDSWYFAEGATYPGFDEWVLIMNPNDQPVVASVNFCTPSRAVAGPTLNLAPWQRQTVHVNEFVPNSDVSTSVFCSTPGKGVVAERSMYMNTPDKCDCHNSLGLYELSPAWALTEGATYPGFEEWILVMNPSAQSATVHFEFLTPSGSRQGPSINVRPNQRATVRVNDSLPNSDVSTIVRAENNGTDVGIVAERSMYINAGERRGATNSVGAAYADECWYLPEGCTLPGFEEWILVMNPWADGSVSVKLEFMGPNGVQATTGTTLPPLSRRTFRANDYTADSISTKVQVTGATSSSPYVICERAMYMNEAIGKFGAHDSLGIESYWLITSGSGSGASAPKMGSNSLKHL